LSLQDEPGPETSSPVKTQTRAAKPSRTSASASSKKRASPDAENGVSKKRRKIKPDLSSEEALSSPPSEMSEVEEQKDAPKPTIKKSTKKSTIKQTEKPTKLSTATTKPVESTKKAESVPKASESELSDVPSEPPNPNKAEASDSELSVLIDDEPPRKKKRKGTSAPVEKRGGKKAPAPKAKPKPDTTDADADQSEIKRLQGWLVKCGIRKLWGKELKPYESPSAKIKHLKTMLTDAGMTGRYSIEKASQIKERRELKADIEAVKEGAVRWGKDKNAQEDVEEGDSDARMKPKKRLVRGAQVLDFLSSDGEETD
jgi:hypothetical protein